MIRNAVARLLLLMALCGFGSMMGPRQTEFTHSRDAHVVWTVIFSIMAVAAVSLIVEELKAAWGASESSAGGAASGAERGAI